MCSTLYVYKIFYFAGQITETVWRRALNHYMMHLMKALNTSVLFKFLSLADRKSKYLF